ATLPVAQASVRCESWFPPRLSNDARVNARAVERSVALSAWSSKARATRGVRVVRSERRVCELRAGGSGRRAPVFDSPWFPPDRGPLRGAQSSFGDQAAWCLLAGA